MIICKKVIGASRKEQRKKLSVHPKNQIV